MRELEGYKMTKNTGARLESEVYDAVDKLIKSNDFLVSEPNVKVRKKPKYYSKDRHALIEFDVSVEKYLADPDKIKDLHPSMIIVLECKDYNRAIPVDDIEEFHAKLQQIGADNTKGIMITRTGGFQKSALMYSKAKGITLARILPEDQIHYILYCRNRFGLYDPHRTVLQSFKALTEITYISDGECFFSSEGEGSLKELIYNILQK